MINCSRLSKYSVWVVGLLASPLFALPVVESRTGDPVVSTVAAPATGHSSSSASSPSTYRISAEDRAAHLTLIQIETLQRELSELRGLVETQDHQIKQLKKSQQDLYLDLESRLRQMQTVAKANPPVKASKPIAEMPVSSTATPRPAASAALSAAPAVNPSATPLAPAKPKDAPKDAKVGAASNLVKPTSAAPANASASAVEQEAYQAAYGLVRTKRYPEAIAALQGYLNRFPKGENVGSAHYWLGEVFMVQWQNDRSNVSLLDKASNEFSTINTQFPNHSKTMDAILKLGLIEFDKGNQAAAEQYLTEVKTRYPGTAAARIAETRLQQISSD